MKLQSKTEMKVIKEKANHHLQLRNLWAIQVMGNGIPLSLALRLYHCNDRWFGKQMNYHRLFKFRSIYYFDLIFLSRPVIISNSYWEHLISKRIYWINEFEMNKYLIWNNLITILIFIVVLKTSCPILKLKEK